MIELSQIKLQCNTTFHIKVSQTINLKKVDSHSSCHAFTDACQFLHICLCNLKVADVSKTFDNEIL